MALSTGKVGVLLGSPVVGGIAGVLVPKEECGTIPATTVEGVKYEAATVCHDVFNTEVGAILTLIGWGLVGISWLVGERGE